MSVVVDCPIDTTINVLKGKCKAGIIKKIHSGLSRFGLLKKDLAISDKLLAIQLNDLVEDGIITKLKNDDNPLQTIYDLTIDGKHLFHIIELMEEWGKGYKFYRQSNIKFSSAEV